jgi:hypothetical protein
MRSDGQHASRVSVDVATIAPPTDRKAKEGRELLLDHLHGQPRIAVQMTLKRLVKPESVRPSFLVDGTYEAVFTLVDAAPIPPDPAGTTEPSP